MKPAFHLAFAVLFVAAASLCLRADEQVAMKLAKIAPLTKIRSAAVLDHLTERRAQLEIMRAEVKQKVENFNALGPVKPGSAAEAKRRRDLAELAGAVKACTQEVTEFNTVVEDEAVCGQTAQTEQDFFATNREAWAQAMKSELVKTSEPRARAMTEEILEALKQSGGRTPLAKLPKTTADLVPGDILLMKPDATSRMSKMIPSADQHYRQIGAFFSDDPQPQTERHDIAHTVLYLRSVNGKRLYLDHQIDEGSRVLDEREFQARYSQRLSHVAIPQSAVDGERLWTAARAAALHSGPGDFGVLGHAQVCSEKDLAVVVFASDARLSAIYAMVGGRGRAVEVTPSNFFNEKLQHGYFTVTSLKAP